MEKIEAKAKKVASIYDDRCPLISALDVIGGKWKLPIIWFLAQGECVRFNELKRRVTGITNIMLTKCLRELEADGLVLRKEFPTVPPHVEYSLAPPSLELVPILSQFYAWGSKFAAQSHGKVTQTAASAQDNDLPKT